MLPEDHQPVLLYDGECGLCHRVVRLLLRTDRRGRLKFAPLQSAAVQEYLLAQGLSTTDLDSMVFVPDWEFSLAYPPLLATDAALAAADELGGIWRLVTWLRVLPWQLRDPFYKLVARLRYTLFGKYRGKPLAESEWKDRFL